MSKGSRPRPYSVSQEIFGSNYDLIFGRKDKVQVRVEENTDDIGKCGCGRSPTGKCIGWHSLTEEEYEAKIKAEAEGTVLDSNQGG